MSWLSQGFEPIKSLSTNTPRPMGIRAERQIMSKKAMAIRNAAIKAIADGIMSFTEAQAYCAKFGITL